MTTTRCDYIGVTISTFPLRDFDHTTSFGWWRFSNITNHNFRQSFHLMDGWQLCPSLFSGQPPPRYPPQRLTNLSTWFIIGHLTTLQMHPLPERMAIHMTYAKWHRIRIVNTLECRILSAICNMALFSDGSLRSPIRSHLFLIPRMKKFTSICFLLQYGLNTKVLKRSDP
jgi:hypothetical protein